MVWVICNRLLRITSEAREYFAYFIHVVVYLSNTLLLYCDLSAVYDSAILRDGVNIALE